MKFELPELQYDYDSLEPYIDAQTMKFHHDKHHHTYVDKLNAALEGQTHLQSMTIEEILMDLNAVPENIRTAIRNHGGGHANHSFFWEIMKKDAEPKGDVVKEIEKKFGSFQKFREAFSAAAVGHFGSGWAWLVLNKSHLEIMAMANQDSPLSQGKIPLLCIDVWEHAYYIKHFWNRAAYVQDWWNVVNWKQVNENYKQAIKK